MICPYRKSRHIYEKQLNFPDDKGYEYTFREDHLYEECRKEECGAWCENKCNYKEK